MKRAAYYTIVLSIVSTVGAAAPLLAHPSHEESLKVLHARVLADSVDVSDYLERGQVYLQIDHLDLAEADFLKALSLEPSSGLAELHLAQLALRRKDPSKALVHLAAAAAKGRNGVENAMLRAEVYASTGDHRAAAEQLSKVIQSAPRSTPDLYLERDEHLAQVIDAPVSERIIGLQEGVARLGHLVVLIERLVALQVESKRYAAALSNIDALPRNVQTQPKWILKKARLLEAGGRSDEAKVLYAEAEVRIAALPPQRKQAALVSILLQEIKKGRDRIGKAESD